jgi:hypothetical protein
MSGTAGQTLEQLVSGISGKVSLFASSIPGTSFFGSSTTSSVNRAATNVGEPSTLNRILAYGLAILIVIFVILLFVHFFIRPIFQMYPGGPGIIPVPGGDDGVLFWNKGSSAQIQNKDLPIADQYFNYSIQMDMFIQNPVQFSKNVRVLFSRGATQRQIPSGDSILGVLDNYNLVAGLLPDTSDLIVSVLNKDNNMENVIVPNIPVQEPFRLHIVLMEQALEVYLNGHLMKTRAFDAPPKHVAGDIYPAMNVEANIAKIRNLKIWSRIITTGEVRESKPSLLSAKDFDATPMPSSTSCNIKGFDTSIITNSLASLQNMKISF